MPQNVASIARQVGAIAISGAYAALLAAGEAKQVPGIVDAVIVAFGPVVVSLEHYLGDPSTGTSVVTTPIAQKQTAPVLPTVVTQISPTVLAPPTSAPNSAV
jgi:hypothetical protein